jgi:FkbM family methyltransferase
MAGSVALFTAQGDAVYCRQLNYLGNPFCYPEASQIGAAISAGVHWDQVLKPIVETLLPQPNPVVVEVGSNIGASILEVLAVRPQARIVCYEPSDRYRAVLEHNLGAAGHNQVDVRASIVGTEPGTGQIHTDETSGRMGHMAHLTRSQAAPVVRLDDDFAGRTEPVELLKVDTDGYDMEVLRSAEKMLVSDQPVLFIEFCPALMDSDPIADITWLQGLGYANLVCLDNWGNYVGTTDDAAQVVAWSSADSHCDILAVASGSPGARRLAEVTSAIKKFAPSRGRRAVSHLDESARSAAAFQAECLARVDLRRHNAGGSRPTFPNLQSQAVTAAQCETPEYLAMAEQIVGRQGDLAGLRYNRKVWEYAYIAQAVAEAGLLKEGTRAVGFGVDSEPLPTFFASHGVDVVATDRIPDAAGSFDVVWSSSVVAHMGSPERGLEFVLESCALLKPGGVAIHMTELELTEQPETRDYGHCAVHRIEDLAALEPRLAELGCAATFNFDVSMDTFEDRWISLVLHPDHGPRLPDPDGVHLRLAVGESVSTSFGILIRRP